MSVWQVAPVALKVTSKDGPVDQIVAGWVNGPLALDFRVFEDDVGDYVNGGFVLTHIATGMVVRQLVGVGQEEAWLLADEIADGADWSFTDAPSEAHRNLIRDIMGKYPAVVGSGHALIGPGR